MDQLAPLRSALGPQFASMSDEELLRRASEATGRPVEQVAADYGVGFSSGKNASRLSSSIDSYQANLYGLGEAATGSDWMRKQRMDNETAADVSNANARRLGAVDAWKDVHGVRDFGDYAVGLGIQSVPYAIEAGAGGFVARGLSTGLRAAGGAAREMGMSAAEQSIARQLATRSAIGGAVASYPSSVGDILSNQREQLRATGRSDSNVDLGQAAIGGVPYAAANYFSPLERLASGSALPRLARGLDAVPGAKGAALRIGANGAIMGAAGASEETFQELMNQRYGRMAVDPNETMTSPGAMDRYKESAVGGGLLGSLASGVGGGWKRSEKWHEDQARAQIEAQRAAALESGSKADLLSTRPDYDLQSYGQADGPLFNQQVEAPTQQHYADPRQINLMSGVNEFVNGQPVELTSDELRGNRMPFVPAPVDRAGGLSLRNDAPMGNEIDYAPEQRQIASNFGLVNEGGPQGDFFGGGGGERVPTQARPDFELAMQDGRQGELFNQQPTRDAPTAPTEPVIGQTNQRGVTGQLPFSGAVSPKAQVLLPLIESLAREGHMDDSTATQAATLVATSKFAAAKKIVDNALKEKAAADSILAKAQSVYSKNQPVTQPAQTAGVAVQGAGVSQPTPVAPTPTADDVIAIGPQRGKGGVVTVKVGSKTVSVKPLHYNRLKALLGLDSSGLPTGDRQTLEQVAKAEGLTGKQARSTIAHSLSLFGLNEEKINAILDYGTSWMQGASPEEASDGTSRANTTPHVNHDVAAFAQSNEDGNTGMRIEPTMAAAAKGSPIVNRDNYSRPDGRGGQVTRVEDKVARKQADDTLKEAGTGDAREVYDPAKDEALPQNKARVLEKARADMTMLKRSPQHYKMVADKWNEFKSSGTAAFDQLNLVAQFRWFNGLIDLQKESQYDDGTLNTLQRDIERIYGQEQNVDGQPGGVRQEGTGTTSPARTGTPTKPAEAQVQGADQARAPGQVDQTDTQQVQALRDEISQYEQLLACIKG